MVEDNIMQIIPQIVERYWDYDLNTQNPDEISFWSNKKYYWRNNSDIIFHLSPINLWKPLSNTSRGERKAYCLLKQIFPKTYSRYVFNGIELDAYTPEINFAVEYDGAYFHQNKELADIDKIQRCKDLGIFLLRIRDSKLPALKGYEDNVLIFDHLDSSDFLPALLNKIKQHTKYNGSKSCQEIVNNFNMSNYDSDMVSSTIYLLAGSEYIDSNIPIKNYYYLHKSQILETEIFNNFVLLAHTILPKCLFEGIRNDILVKKFYNETSKYGRVINLVVDIYSTNDDDFLMDKIKELIDSPMKNWFLSMLRKYLDKFNQQKDFDDIDHAKFLLLSNAARYFRMNYSDYYLIDELNLLLDNIDIISKKINPNLG